MISALLFAAGTAIIISIVGNKAVPTAEIQDAAPYLVIDAGHGGMDGGATAADGTKESGINLAIAQRLCDLCLFLGEDCAMTRTSETLSYPPEAVSVREKKRWDQERRIAQINSNEHAVLISIHQNHYPDPRPAGTQVMYAATDGSKAFAEITHENLRQLLCQLHQRRRLALVRRQQVDPGRIVVPQHRPAPEGHGQRLFFDPPHMQGRGGHTHVVPSQFSVILSAGTVPDGMYDRGPRRCAVPIMQAVTPRGPGTGR